MTIGPSATAAASLLRRCLRQANSSVCDLHHWRMPAIDVDRGPGDVGGLIRRQEACQIGELFRLADTAQRNVLGAARDVIRKWDAFLGGALHMLIGFDE